MIVDEEPIRIRQGTWEEHEAVRNPWKKAVKESFPISSPIVRPPVVTAVVDTTSGTTKAPRPSPRSSPAAIPTVKAPSTTPSTSKPPVVSTRPDKASGTVKPPSSPRKLRNRETKVTRTRRGERPDASKTGLGFKVTKLPVKPRTKIVKLPLPPRSKIVKLPLKLPVGGTPASGGTAAKPNGGDSVPPTKPYDPCDDPGMEGIPNPFRTLAFQEVGALNPDDIVEPPREGESPRGPSDVKGPFAKEESASEGSDSDQTGWFFAPIRFASSSSSEGSDVPLSLGRRA